MMYVQMAGRGGLVDLPPHSLIELTHGYADFVEKVYLRIKEELLKSRVLQADETPHKMLEGSEKKSWYLWGVSTKTESYFECRNTRSGDVAGELLKKSICEILLTDVYTGYGNQFEKPINFESLKKSNLFKVPIVMLTPEGIFLKARIITRGPFFIWTGIVKSISSTRSPRGSPRRKYSP